MLHPNILRTYLFVRYEQQARKIDAITDTAEFHGIQRDTLESFVDRYL